MSTQISTPVESEILTQAELVELSGRSRKDAQIAWLRLAGWKFTVNAVEAPIVGRWYARMKLAGVDLSAAATPLRVAPDFSKVR